MQNKDSFISISYFRSAVARLLCIQKQTNNSVLESFLVVCARARAQQMLSNALLLLPLLWRRSLAIIAWQLLPVPYHGYINSVQAVVCLHMQIVRLYTQPELPATICSRNFLVERHWIVPYYYTYYLRQSQLEIVQRKLALFTKRSTFMFIDGIILGELILFSSNDHLKGTQTSFWLDLSNSRKSLERFLGDTN